MSENRSKYHTILWLDRALCQKTTPNITPFYGLTVFYVKNHSKYHTILWLDRILFQKSVQISHHFMASPYSILENHSKYHTILWLDRILCQKNTPNITPFYGLTVFYVRKPLQISHHFMALPYSMLEITPNISPFYGLTVFYVRKPLQITHHFMARPYSMSENHSKYLTILWLDRILCQKTTPNITSFYGFTVFYVRKPLQISHHFMALPYSMLENHSKYLTILWLDRILCQKTTPNNTPFYGLTVFYV